MFLFSDALTGLTHATPLFLLSAALTLTFRATRLLDLSQAAIAGLGALLATRLPLDPALAIPAAILALAFLGAATERLLLRRLYQAPLLSQLLAAVGLFLLFHDAAQPFWSRPSLSPPAWLAVSVAVGPLTLPVGTLLLVALLPLSAALLGRLPHLVPADPLWHRTATVALSAALAALAGMLAQLTPSTAPTPDIDLLAAALMVLLLGGLGSLSGAFVASLVVAVLQSLAAGLVPHASLALPLVPVAAMLLIRPHGLFGRPIPEPTAPPLPIRPTPVSARLLFALALLLAVAALLLAPPAALPFLADAAIAILLAAGLHLLLGPAGIPSLGHAAFFGIGAWACAKFLPALPADTPFASLAAPLAGLLAAAVAALLVGTVLLRASARTVAMLTLVLADLVWSALPLVPLPGPTRWSAPPTWLVVALCIGITLLLRRLLYAPVGYALRAARDNPVRAAAIGLPIPLLRLIAFTLSGTVAGLAGALAVVATASLLPGDLPFLTVLLMPLLGGLQAISGPVVGALAYAGLAASSVTPLLFGPALVALVLFLPDGIAGTAIRAWRRAP